MRFRSALALFSAMIAGSTPAFAQKTPAAIQTEINNEIYNCGTNCITGKVLNGVLQDIVQTFGNDAALLPGLIAGANITITGQWPNQLISASGGGSGSPGGSSGQIQYNNAGSFGGLPTAPSVSAAFGTALNGSGAIAGTTAPAFVTPSWTTGAQGDYLLLGTIIGRPEAGSLFTSGQIITNLNSAVQPLPTVGTGFHLTGSDSNQARILIDSFANLSTLSLRRADSTNSSPSALQVNDQIGGVSFLGYNGTGYSSVVAGLGGYAAENWTSTHEGTYLQIVATPTSGATTNQTVTKFAASSTSAVSETVGVQQSSQGSLILSNTAAGAYPTTLQSSNSATAASTLVFPPALAGSGPAILTDAAGNGVLSWSNINSGVLTALGLSLNGTGAISATTSPTFVTPILGAASATSLGLTGAVSGSSSVGVVNLGTLTYSDTYVFSSFQASNNGYVQSIWQNTNSGSAASADVIVSNNLGTASTYYGDFGINSSGFSGPNSFSLPNAVYVQATSGDLTLGTTTSNAIHFVINGGATDAGGFSTGGVFSVQYAPIMTALTGYVYCNGATACSAATTIPASSLSGTSLPAAITTASGLTTAAGGAFGTGAYASAYTLPAATSSTLGGVKPDGTTIANSSGAISVNSANLTGIPLSGLAAQATYTFLANNTAGSTSPTAVTSNSGVFTAMGNTVNAASGLLTYSIIGTSGATVPLLNAAATFSGAVSHTSTFIASGAGATSAANSTSIMGGLVAPTMGSNAGFLTIGGVYTLPTLTTTGQGTISLSASNGLQLQGDGSSNDVCLMSKSAACVVGVKTGAGGISLAGGLYNATTSKLFASGTAPTYGSGFGTSAALGAVNGTWKFDIAITTGTGATGIVNLPTASTDWNCFANSKSNPTTIRVWQTGFATNSATFAPYTAAGVLSAWASPDTIAISCFAN